jgi:hypothetical protein
MQLVCPQKDQSFRPSKFELVVMDSPLWTFTRFYEILFSYYKEIGYWLQMICYDLILIFYKAIYSTKIDISRCV